VVATAVLVVVATAVLVVVVVTAGSAVVVLSPEQPVAPSTRAKPKTSADILCVFFIISP
jgi:hypothetical protein